MRISRLLLTGLVVTAALPAAAQLNPFQGSRTGLTQRDVDLLSSSIGRLNSSKDIAVGSKDSWSNAASRSRGQNVVREIFQDGGTTCHRLHHTVTVKGRTPPRTYDLTWCRTADGSWKIKS
jgi:hypothetical protein